MEEVEIKTMEFEHSQDWAHYWFGFNKHNATWDGFLEYGRKAGAIIEVKQPVSSIWIMKIDDKIAVTVSLERKCSNKSLLLDKMKKLILEEIGNNITLVDKDDSSNAIVRNANNDSDMEMGTGLLPDEPLKMKQEVSVLIDNSFVNNKFMVDQSPQESFHMAESYAKEQPQLQRSTDNNLLSSGPIKSDAESYPSLFADNPPFISIVEQVSMPKKPTAIEVKNDLKSSVELPKNSNESQVINNSVLDETYIGDVLMQPVAAKAVPSKISPPASPSVPRALPKPYLSKARPDVLTSISQELRKVQMNKYEIDEGLLSIFRGFIGLPPKRDRKPAISILKEDVARKFKSKFQDPRFVENTKEELKSLGLNMYHFLVSEAEGELRYRFVVRSRSYIQCSLETSVSANNREVALALGLFDLLDCHLPLVALEVVSNSLKYKLTKEKSSPASSQSPKKTPEMLPPPITSFSDFMKKSSTNSTPLPTAPKLIVPKQTSPIVSDSTKNPQPQPLAQPQPQPQPKPLAQPSRSINIFNPSPPPQDNQSAQTVYGTPHSTRSINSVASIAANGPSGAPVQRKPSGSIAIVDLSKYLGEEVVSQTALFLNELHLSPEFQAMKPKFKETAAKLLPPLGDTTLSMYCEKFVFPIIGTSPTLPIKKNDYGVLQVDGKNMLVVKVTWKYKNGDESLVKLERQQKMRTLLMLVLLRNLSQKRYNEVLVRYNNSGKF
jgi:hypothetical protein